MLIIILLQERLAILFLEWMTTWQLYQAQNGFQDSIARVVIFGKY